MFLALIRPTDYRTLLSLLPESSAQWSEINRTLRNLEPRVGGQRKEEMGEMMGKLKELGNTFLGLPHNPRPWVRSDEIPQVALASQPTISNSNQTDKGDIP